MQPTQHVAIFCYQASHLLSGVGIAHLSVYFPRRCLLRERDKRIPAFKLKTLTLIWSRQIPDSGFSEFKFNLVQQSHSVCNPHCLLDFADIHNRTEYSEAQTLFSRILNPITVSGRY